MLIVCHCLLSGPYLRAGLGRDGECYSRRRATSAVADKTRPESSQIGSTVLQNELGKRLPADYLARFPEGLEIIYAVIPTIRNIKDPLLQAAVKKAFADSLQLLCSYHIALTP